MKHNLGEIKQSILLGKIMGQHEAVFRARAAIFAQKKVAETAARWARGYGHFEDCGDGYREDKVVQDSILEHMVQHKITEERHLKRMKHEFKEEYPEFDLSGFLIEVHKDNKLISARS